MIRKRVVYDDPPPIVLSRRAEIAFLILLLAVVGFLSRYLFYAINCVDGCDPYHNGTNVADLDGDLKVLARHLTPPPIGQAQPTSDPYHGKSQRG